MRLRAIYFRIIKSKPALILLSGLVVLVIGGLVVVARLSAQLGSAESRAEYLREHPTIVKLLPVYWSVRKLGDIAYLPYLFKKDRLPTYALEITDENLQTLNDSLPQEFMSVIYYNKVYVPAKFFYEGKEYDVEVRYRGDTAVHWNAPKKSYHVRFDKDAPFAGFRELAFIIPDDRGFAVEQVNNYRAEKFGLKYPPSFFANLRLNGKKQGLFFVTEGWTQEMLMKWEVPDEANLYGDADIGPAWDKLSGWDLKVADSQFSYEHFTEMKQLFSLVNDSSDEEFFAQIFGLVDENDFYSWQILLHLANSVHGNQGNIQFYFDDSSGKFHFVPWDVIGDPASVDNFDVYGPIAARIFSNPVFLHEKNKRLYEYLADEKNLQDDLYFYDATFESIRPALYKDRLKIYTNRWADGVVRENRARLIAVAARLKEKLEQGGPIVAEIEVNANNSIGVNGNNLLASIDVSVRSIPEYYLLGAEPSFASEMAAGHYELYYEANGNDQFDAADTLISDPRQVSFYSAQKVSETVNAQGSLLEPQDTRHRFYLVSKSVRPSDFAGNLTAMDLNLENAITGQPVQNNDIEIKLLSRDAFKYLQNISDVDLFERENPIFRVNRQTGEITLPAGSYQINKTIVIPKGFTVTIPAGTTLALGPDVSIVSYSPVYAQGSVAEPINVIRADSARPWGTFAVVNTGDRRSDFRYFLASGGKNAYLNGIFFIGMVSVYHSDVLVFDSEFSGSSGDDGLNVKNATITIANSRFIRNGFDGLDLDFIKQGEILGNNFVDNGNDGLDLSGSGALLVTNNEFLNSGDKCISIGERSVDPKIFNNLLSSCKIGIEVKDGSTPRIINNAITGNQIGINAYVKKPVFGGGTGYVYNSIFWNNQTDFQTDAASSLEISHSNFKGADGTNGNFNTAPPSDYRFPEGGDGGVLRDILNVELNPAPVGLIP